MSGIFLLIVVTPVLLWSLNQDYRTCHGKSEILLFRRCLPFAINIVLSIIIYLTTNVFQEDFLCLMTSIGIFVITGLWVVFAISEFIKNRNNKNQKTKFHEYIWLNQIPKGQRNK